MSSDDSEEGALPPFFSFLTPTIVDKRKKPVAKGRKTASKPAAKKKAESSESEEEEKPVSPVKKVSMRPCRG